MADKYQLEDGTGFYQMEDGLGNLLLEVSAAPPFILEAIERHYPRGIMRGVGRGIAIWLLFFSNIILAARYISRL